MFPLSEWEEPLPSSALEEISEDEAIQIVAEPPLPFESFTLQDYVDRSETLQRLVLLGKHTCIGRHCLCWNL